MFCPNCGVKNEDDAIFCQSCGANLLEDPQAQQSSVQQTAPQSVAQQPVQQPVQQNYQQPYGNYGSTATQAPPVQQTYYAASNVPSGAPKKKLSLAQILIPVIIVLVVAAGIISYAVLSNMCSPDRVVKDFYQSGIDGNWDKMYSYLDITKGDFDSQAEFTRLMKANIKDSDLSNITNYTIKPATGSSNSSLSKKYIVEYTVKGESGTQSESVTVTKAKGNKFLFFDNWDVSVGSLVAKSYSIDVPKGATLTVDDIQVNKSYLKSASNSGSSSKSTSGSKSNSSYSSDNYNYNSTSDNLDTYVLTNIFLGSHDVKVTTSYTEPYSNTITVDEGGSTTVSGLKLSAETLTTLTKQASDAVQTIYNSAIANKSFDTISSLFTTNEQDDASSTYSSIVKSATGQSSYSSSYSTVLKSFTLSNAKLYNSNPTLRSDGSIYISIKFNYTYTSTTKMGSSTSDYTPSSPESDYVDFYYTYSGGKWLICSMNDIDLYY